MVEAPKDTKTYPFWESGKKYETTERFVAPAWIKQVARATATYQFYREGVEYWKDEFLSDDTVIDLGSGLGNHFYAIPQATM